jgi:hypothetical protein
MVDRSLVTIRSGEIVNRQSLMAYLASPREPAEIEEFAPGEELTEDANG